MARQWTLIIHSVIFLEQALAEFDDFLCITNNIPIYVFQIASYSSLSTVG